MAQSGRFGLAVRVLAVLATEPHHMHTSAAIAASINSSPVMVRRIFSTLHKADFITQKKGPQGGARLNHSAKSIGLGDVYLAVEPKWLVVGDKAFDALSRRVRESAIAVMNETTISAITRKLRKSA
jgi:DNA-binding IscR family transcriptional regulator